MVLIHYYMIWTDNGSMLPEANTWRQESKYPIIKVLQGCILKLLLHSVNSVSILYRAGNIQSAILLSFVASSSLLSCGLQSTHPQMPCYISPYVIYNICGVHTILNKFTYSTLAWSAKVSKQKHDHGLPVTSFPINSELRRPCVFFQSRF